jgi:2-octaprenylphenol hydroxylase
MKKFDILIVGGGMVGLTLALAIRKQTALTIAIVDTAPLAELSDKPDVRVSAINLASKQIFENLAVWSQIKKLRHQPYEKMHVWDKAGYGQLDFSLDDLSVDNSQNNDPQLGWIIENNHIRHALWQQAERDEGISFYTDEPLTNIGVGESEIFASFTSQSPITAKLVVGADGANSWVRNQMDMAITFRDYDHHAIVATVKCSQGHQNTAWQVFLEEGPLALLPLCANSSSESSLTKNSVNDLCSIVWSTSPDEAKRLSDLSKDEFSKELTAASDGKLGNITAESQRFTYPLTMRMAQEFVKKRVALVGDAAHTIHPLAGQGVNLGLLDAASLAQVIANKLAKDEIKQQDSNAWFDAPTLNNYARWRKAEAGEMIAAMESIKQVFTPQQDAAKLLRGLGLSLINNVKPIKAMMIKQALGFKGQLPDLAKPVDKL